MAFPRNASIGARSGRTPLSQLWQMPLLAASLGLFGYAAYLLYDPRPGPTVDQQIDLAGQFLKVERPEAAVDQLNRVLKLDKLTTDQATRVHLMVAEAMAVYQSQKRVEIPAVQLRIIEQTRLASATGPIDAAGYRRVAVAYEKLQHPVEALENYKKAQGADPKLSLALARKVINLELDQDDTAAADRDLAEYLKTVGLTDAERCWALGQRAQILADEGQFADSRILLSQALKLTADTLQEGEINYRLGYVAWKLGDNDNAERYLTVARQQFAGKHPLDADACLLLGKLAQVKNDPKLATALYSTILSDYPGAKAEAQAKLGLGLCRAMEKDDDAALETLTSLAKAVDEQPKLAADRPDVIAGLKQAGAWLASRGNTRGALELLSSEQLLNPNPGPDFFARLAAVYETRGNQLAASLGDLAPTEKLKQQRESSDAFAHAGDACVSLAHKQAGGDDKAYGDSLWHGIGMYDRANATPAAINALELFIAERPEDPITPDAVLRLGKLYQLSGQLDKAIAAYQKNQLRYPKSLAASKSAVPLAQAYIAKGPDNYGRAEVVLTSVLDNNPVLDPSSQEFRQALFELGQLDYRTQRYEDAIVHLDEYAKRYPPDERNGQLLFLTGDSYRKSAQQLMQKLATASTSKEAAFDPAEVEKARRTRLQHAKELYDKVVDLYRNTPPTLETEKLYYKLANFYRADCLYDLGEYDQAITLYDNAAFRFQDDPSALAAYVQIVNAWCRLGKPEQAKSANERAKWLLRRIPPDAFSNGTFSMPKEYWEEWLKWSNESGMW